MQRIIEQQGTQADVHRNFRAIFASTKELQPNPHWTSVWGSEIVLPMGGMDLTEALGEEQFELLPQELRTRIAKDDFCLPVHHHHGPGLIDDHQRVRRNVQERT